MPLANVSPYDKCPEYETEFFKVRLVKKGDAADLLSCYSDPLAAPLFNSENCTSDFVFNTVEDSEVHIDFWLKEYRQKNYIRFSIIDKALNKAIGTIEMFADKKEISSFGRVGILRLDLASYYEKSRYIEDLLILINAEFPRTFICDSILTKIIPRGVNRITALYTHGYRKVEAGSIVSYDDCYVRTF